MNFVARRSWSERTKRIDTKKKIKQNKTQKQSSEKEHNKHLRVYRAGIKLYGHLFIQPFSQKPYLKEKKNYFKLIALKAYLNYLDARNSPCVLVHA